MMHWGTDFGMGFGGGWFFMIFFWVIIILLAVYLVKLLIGGKPAEDRHSESAREVLEKRFARGEITKEEFENAIEVLKRSKT
jgi:putative membrane protein